MARMKGWGSLLSLCIVCLVHLSPSAASSDPYTSLCGPVCWEEDALAEQCAQDRCQKLAGRPRAQHRCEDRCWTLVVPCRQLCQDHTLNVLNLCERQCASTVTQGDGDCQLNCFSHNMMTIKARVLPREPANSTAT